MSALPLQTLLPAAPASGAAAGAAVLPATLLPLHFQATGSTGAAGAAQRAALPPRFDQALQQLLAASGQPLPTDADAAALPAAAPAATATEEADAAELQAQAAPLRFDPALASLVPPPALPVALPQASQAAAPAQSAPAPAIGQPAPLAMADSAMPAVPAARGAAPALPPAGGSTTAPASTLPGADQPAPALPLERLAITAPAQAATGEAGAAPRAVGDAAAPGRTPSLLQQLGERVAVQLERGSERVVIRLDPPHRGQIEILIRQDASGATQVQLSASHGDVVRQLHAIGDSLRQELAQRQGGDVSVQIAQQSRDPDGRQRQEREAQPQQQPGRALADTDDDAAPARFALAGERA